MKILKLILKKYILFIKKYKNNLHIDIKTLMKMRDSLYVKKKNDNSVTMVKDFHIDLERKYHKKSRTFLDLWEIFKDEV